MGSYMFLHVEYTTVQMLMVSKVLKNNTFIEQEHIYMIKSDSKDIWNVAKYFYFKKLLKDIDQSCTKIISSITLFSIHNKKCFLSFGIIIIFYLALPSQELILFCILKYLQNINIYFNK